jgi:putative mRNA 3-end processing factor
VLLLLLFYIRPDLIKKGYFFTLMALLTNTDCGLFCKEGNFYIDPWKPVERAVITHGHSDHARPGMKHYLAAEGNKHLLYFRLGDIDLQIVKYGEVIDFNGVKVSLHPAGHIQGSSQVRVEKNGEVWVVSGDYKLEPDKTCTPFEHIKCHTFITESTFGLPVYHWQPQQNVFNEINKWWAANKESGRASIIYCYALGKAQRVLSGLDSSIGPIITHGAVENINNIYRNSGISLPDTIYAGNVTDKKLYREAVIVAPPSGDNVYWTRKFGPMSTAFASGWMQIRGNRRRRSVDRGFVLSDHVDWDSLLLTIKESGAENIFVTHGYTQAVVKWLCETGLNAKALQTQFVGEIEEEGTVTGDPS